MSARWLFTLFVAAAPSAAGAKALSALVTFETHAVTSDGVTRDARYQERVYRDDAHMWMERVLPAVPPIAPAGHRHGIDLVRLARHVRPAARGTVTVELVSEPDRLIVDVEPADLSRVDLTNRWDDTYFLVSPEVRHGLRPMTTPAPAGARWLERRDAGGYVRVLWSDKLDFPLVIERGRSDGSDRLRIRVEPNVLPAAAPWTRLGGYAHKDLADFSD